ncbi:MAG: hypothetical protein ACK5JF_10315 [Oscillospiraceae bacterium]
MNEFFTWDTLGTLAGATVGVTLMTEFAKWIFGKKIYGWMLNCTSFVSALIILYSASFFGGALNPATAVLTFLNAVVVTMAANGLFDNIKSIKG